MGLRGIPDESGYPSVVMDYETVVNIRAPGGATNAWAAEIYGLAHPIQPMSVKTTSDGGGVGYVSARNPTVADAVGYNNITHKFAELCNSWRMLYHGMTIDLDASGLNNQGSVVACQYPMASQTFNASLWEFEDAGKLHLYPHVVNATFASNTPGMALTQLPGAFMGLAKDGIYIPTKIRPDARWVNSRQVIMLADPEIPEVDPRGDQVVTLPQDVDTTGSCFPLLGTDGPPFVPAYTHYESGPLNGGQLRGSITQDFQQENITSTVFYNLSPAASLTCKIRWGVEMRVAPGSILSPAMQPSAQFDPVAMATYSAMAGALPWAYPSSYNSLDDIVKVLKSTWNGIKPLVATGLGLIPHPMAQQASAIISSLPHFSRPSGDAFTAAVNREEARMSRRNPKPRTLKAANIKVEYRKKKPVKLRK